MNLLATAKQIDLLIEEFNQTLPDAVLEEGIGDFFSRIKDYGKEKLQKLLEYIKSAIARLKSIFVRTKDAQEVSADAEDAVDKLHEAQKVASTALRKAKKEVQAATARQKALDEVEAELDKVAAAIRSTDEALDVIQAQQKEIAPAEREANKAITQFKSLKQRELFADNIKESVTASFLVEEVLFGTDVAEIAEGFFSSVADFGKRAFGFASMSVQALFQIGKMVVSSVYILSKFSFAAFQHSVELCKSLADTILRDAGVMEKMVYAKTNFSMLGGNVKSEFEFALMDIKEASAELSEYMVELRDAYRVVERETSQAQSTSDNMARATS